MTKQRPNDSYPVLNATDWRPARRSLAIGVCVMAAWLSGCASLSAWLPRGAGAGAWADAGAVTSGGESSTEQLPWGSPVGAVTGAATAAGAVATSAPAVSDPAYRLGPEDGLEISVWKDETLKSTALVRPDGGISFPLVGDLQVAGKTAAEVRAEIVSRLARFVPDAEVTVAVVRVASYRVYVIGRVNKPGDFAVGRPIDVLQALTLAGGMTPFAAEDEIRIIRREGARQVSIPFDYARLRKGGDLSQNITLRSGDVLLVP